MEYPGYSIYTGREVSEENILIDIESVLQYAMNNMGFEKQNIVVVGMSDFTQAGL